MTAADLEVEVRRRVERAKKSTLTARRLDEIVLRAAGHRVDGEVRQAQESSWALHDQLADRVRRRLGVGRTSGGALGCVLIMGLVSQLLPRAPPSAGTRSQTDRCC
jgi:hypothetical protein